MQTLELLPLADRTEYEPGQPFMLDDSVRYVVVHCIVTGVSGPSPSYTFEVSESVDGVNWTALWSQGGSGPAVFRFSDDTPAHYIRVRMYGISGTITSMALAAAR